MVLLGEQNINTEYEAVRYCAVRGEPHFRTRFVEVEVVWNCPSSLLCCNTTTKIILPGTYTRMHVSSIPTTCVQEHLLLAPATAAKKVLHKKKCRNQPVCDDILLRVPCMLVRTHTPAVSWTKLSGTWLVGSFASCARNMGSVSVFPTRHTIR